MAVHAVKCLWSVVLNPVRRHLNADWVWFSVKTWSSPWVLCECNTLSNQASESGFWCRQWACSQRNKSCSESCFGSRSASWLGSWFELRAFTCIANAVPITNRICALRGNILFLLRSPRWLTHAWLQRAFAHLQNAHAQITFQKSFAFTCPQNQTFYANHDPKRPLFRVSKAWFERALRSQRVKSGKGLNHVPKRLSERDSFLCEQAHCVVNNRSSSYE